MPSAWATHSPSQCSTTARPTETKTSCCRSCRRTLTCGQVSSWSTSSFLSLPVFLRLLRVKSSLSSYRELDLKRPIYQSTACYGHFGREEFPWEKPKSLVFWVWDTFHPETIKSNCVLRSMFSKYSSQYNTFVNLWLNEQINELHFSNLKINRSIIQYYLFLKLLFKKITRLQFTEVKSKLKLAKCLKHHLSTRWRQRFKSRERKKSARKSCFFF